MEISQRLDPQRPGAGGGAADWGEWRRPLTQVPTLTVRLVLRATRKQCVGSGLRPGKRRGPAASSAPAGSSPASEAQEPRSASSVPDAV